MLIGFHFAATEEQPYALGSSGWFRRARTYKTARRSEAVLMRRYDAPRLSRSGARTAARSANRCRPQSLVLQ
jgi:hypothetical protein